MLAVWLIFTAFFLSVGYALYDCFSSAEEEFKKFCDPKGYEEIEGACVLRSRALFHRKRILASILFIISSVVIVSTILATDLPGDRASNPRHIEEAEERRTKQVSTTEAELSYTID